MKKFKFIFSTLILSATALAGCNSAAHTHNLTHHDAVAATCTVDGSVEYWSCSGCKKNYSDAQGKTEITELVVKAQGHKYDGQKATYTWNADNSECLAEIKCKNCENKESEKATGEKVTYVIVSEKSCSAKEKRTYTAVFSNSLFSQQVKENVEVGELAAHDYEGQVASYTWSEDNSSCSAEIQCKNCTHKESEVASGENVTYIVVAQKSCTQREKRTYTAVFSNSLFSQQVKENVEIGDLAAHDYQGQKATYEWNADNTECSAEIQCKNCTHKESEVASGENVTDAITKQKSCTQKETHKYTAVFASSLFETQVKDNVEVGELAAHDYEGQTASYDWNAAHTQCSAEIQCKNCTHKETEVASGAKVTDETTAQKTCTTSELHKYTATFDNALFTTQVLENVAVGDPAGHKVVTHAACDPTKSNDGLTTTYYTCDNESGKYYSDANCTNAISADTVASYAIKSFDKLDAMLGGATGANAYDTIKISSAYAYFNSNYSSTAKTAYGNGAVLAAKAKYEGYFTGAELNLETAEYWGMYGSQLLNGADDKTVKYLDFKGSFENTDYGKAYSFKINKDMGDTEWAGARYGGFQTLSGTYVNVFYFYSIGNAKIGLANWSANPIVEWDVVEGWNEIVIPNSVVSTAHAANQFRLVIKGAKANSSYYKFTSVYGVKGKKYIANNIDKLSSYEVYKAITLANELKGLYDKLTQAEQAEFDVSKITAIQNKYYEGLRANIYGKTDNDGRTFERVSNTEVGYAYKITFNSAVTSWTSIFRINLYDSSTGAVSISGYKANDTFVFYTLGYTFTDGEDDTIQIKDHGGSNLVVAKTTHKLLANGWTKHTMTASRSSSLNTYVSGASASQVYLRFYMKTVAAESVIYFSSLFGIHA